MRTASRLNSSLCIAAISSLLDGEYCSQKTGTKPRQVQILRRITQTDLSVSAHKLATLILDGIGWKQGYSGLTRGSAAFTLAALAEKMTVSRQHLSVLLSELETSDLRLARCKPYGKYAPWLFRFAAFDDANADADCDHLSGRGDTSLSREESNKTIFSVQINITATPNVFQTCWADLIKAAKVALPCWNVDTQVIWERFLAFNRARGNETVPAGYLLGFMRRWRTSPGVAPLETTPATPVKLPDPKRQDLMAQIAAAPTEREATLAMLEVGRVAPHHACAMR